MKVERLDIKGYEQVVVGREDEAGLEAIVAIHDTTLGPAVGGTRMVDYPSFEEALADVLRLSRGMTFKAAAAGLAFGGGKAVIVGDPRKRKTPRLLETFGELVESLGGHFLTGEDTGTTAEDMRVVARRTRFAIYPCVDDVQPWHTAHLTAYGVLQGIEACVEEAFGTRSLSGVRVAIQGLGKVGGRLAGLLAAEGAHLTVTDLDQGLAESVAAGLSARVVPSDSIYDAAVDVFAPCALGGVLDDDVVSRLQARIVAGAANNQLAEDRLGTALHRRGILYAPDYLVNAGGLISALYEMGLESRESVLERTRQIYDRTRDVLRKAKETDTPTVVVADRLVTTRLLGRQVRHS